MIFNKAEINKSKPPVFTNESIKEQSDILWNLSIKKESSLINDLFQGQLVHTITCDLWK